jgi:TRAP-type transport system periplasmic protein
MDLGSRSERKRAPNRATREENVTDKNLEKRRTLNVTRREALQITAGCGVTVASVGLACIAGDGVLSFAIAAASEAEKKSKAKHIMTLGLDGTLNLFPDRPVAKHSTWIHGMPEYKEFVEKNSNGQIYVDIHDAGALGGQTAALKKVQQGIIQGASCSTQNAAQLAPIWNVLDVPYTVGPVENHWKLIFSKEFNDSIRAQSEKRRLTTAIIMPYLRWLEMSHNVKKEIRKPEDLKGIKMRVTGSKLEQACFEILPTNSTPIAWSEVFTALKDGAVDGIHTTPTSVLDGGMAPVIGQIVDTVMMYNNDSIWLNTDWINALPGDLKEVVLEANYFGQKKIYDDYEPIHREAIGTTVDGPKVGWKAANTKIVRLSNAERAVWADYLSIERNKSKLNALIDQFGRKEFELVLDIVKTGSPEPRRWWKA